MLRVFDAPQPFLGTLANLSACMTADVSKIDRALGAVIPELGLSNKPFMPISGEAAPAVNSNNIQSGNSEETAEEPSNDALGSLDDEEGGGGLLSPQAALASANAARRAAVSLVRPPLEEALIEHTMWPECNKLYGHAFELVACAATNNDCDGTVAVPLVAATCVARQADHSVIRIWETKSWREVAVLPGHSLSVAQMQFSHNNRYLLSVSRDRSYCLYVRDGTEFGFRLLHSERSAHARIVWTCSFSRDDRYFATGSRDKHVKVWRMTEDGASLDSTLPEFAQGVTAVAFATFSSVQDGLLLAVGLEDGAMQLWLGRPEASSLKWSLMFDFKNGFVFVQIVRFFQLYFIYLMCVVFACAACVMTILFVVWRGKKIAMKLPIT
jgi:elongator complex protein 2